MCFKVNHGQPRLKHALQVYRRIKIAHCKRNLVPSRKQAAYKLPRTEGGLFGPKRPLLRQDNSCSN